MKNLKARIQGFKSRKLSATAVVLVAIASAVAGAFAATIVVNTSSYNFTGEAGTLHQSNGTFTITDKGLVVANNAFASSNTTTALTLGSTNWQVQNVITKGDWVEYITFVDNTPATGTHTATVNVYNGGSTVTGTLLASASMTSGVWTTSSSSTGTVNVYLDTGLTSITSPLTIYVSIT